MRAVTIQSQETHQGEPVSQSTRFHAVAGRPRHRRRAEPRLDSEASTASSGSPRLSAMNITLEPIGTVRSSLRKRAQAPRQAHEGAPEAWIELDPRFCAGVLDVRPGDAILVLTWLDRARRDVLAVHPRGNRQVPLQGVFSTRSPDRPNPIGLHRTVVLAVEQRRVLVQALEALDGTPVLDLKPVLSDVDEA